LIGNLLHEVYLNGKEFLRSKATSEGSEGEKVKEEEAVTFYGSFQC
jgi:hypothetical protein